VVPVVRAGACTDVAVVPLLVTVSKFADKSINGAPVSGNKNVVPDTALNVVVGGVNVAV
jgi:hypothetical protein